MAETTVLQIDLVDPDGKAFTADKVTFTLGSKAVVLKARPFLVDLDKAGDASLQIEKKGHHTYRFELSVRADKKDFTLLVNRKQMLDVPRMLTLLKLGAIGKGPGPGRNQLTVVIGKPREVVLVTGFDYPTDEHKGGTKMHLAGTKRMHELRKAKKIDDSTVITWFDAKSGKRTRWVMGRGKETVTAPPGMWLSGWSRLSIDGTPPETLDPKNTKIKYPGRKPADGGVFGIVQVYEHIAAIGKARPKSLEELSFMAHSYLLGPILFDTFQEAEFEDGANKARRDPFDRDARLKDFSAINMPFRADFVAAFSSTPFVRIWGCLATKVSIAALNRAARAKSDTQALGIPFKERINLFDKVTVFPDTRLGVIQMFKVSHLKANYMAFLAKVIGKTVEGGAPGMGSLFTPTDPFGFQLFVARRNVKDRRKDGKTETILGFKRQMEFMEKNMGSTFTSDGYLLYEPP